MILTLMLKLNLPCILKILSNTITNKQSTLKFSNYQLTTLKCKSINSEEYDTRRREDCTAKSKTPEDFVPMMYPYAYKYIRCIIELI